MSDNKKLLLDVDSLKVHFKIKSDKSWPWSPALNLKAVDGVSIKLYEGETLGVVGESGCGKSTFARAIIGLVPATEGKVVWLGQDLTNWKCLDAFAGTGALGFEAASRGATSVIMNEQDPALVQQLQRLQQKLDAKMVRVQRGDGLSCLKTAAGQDLILLDPPFESVDLFEPSVKAAMAALNDGGFIYLEAPEAWSEERLLEMGLELYRYLKAGAVHAHLLKKQ